MARQDGHRPRAVGQAVRSVALLLAVSSGVTACGSVTSSGTASPSPVAAAGTTATTTNPTPPAPTVTLPSAPADADVTRSPTAGPGVRCADVDTDEHDGRAPRFHEGPAEVPVVLTETRRPADWAEVQGLLEAVSQASGDASPIRFDYYAGRTYQGYEPQDFLRADSDGYVRWVLLFADSRTLTEPDHSLAVLFRGSPGPLEYRVVPASVPEVIRRYDSSHPGNSGRTTMPSVCDFAARAGDDLVFGN